MALGMRSKSSRPTMNPSDILLALDKHDNIHRDPKCIAYFKGYINSNHSFFINSWLQSVLAIKEITDAIKSEPEEGANKYFC